MEEKGEILYEIKPKFDFLYELMMPTGKKMKSALISVIISIILKVILTLAKDQILAMNNGFFTNVYNVTNIILIIAIAFSILLFIARIVMQVLEYNGMSYKFYNNCMIFENNFLNQTRKTIEYADIKEVEIRRTIMDRIMNYGVIIIYTSAEKSYGSATILYSIKNTQEHYNNIESLIHSGKIISSPIKSENHDAFKEQLNLQNAMAKTEEYNESNALSDVNPLNKRED
ncbi:MAG: PH domain-containing protein [Clostridia bacterium]|nr:PH domain-containing protein [Clostridia bacterium]